MVWEGGVKERERSWDKGRVLGFKGILKGK